jgi:hypothetical protein
MQNGNPRNHKAFIRLRTLRLPLCALYMKPSLMHENAVSYKMIGAAINFHKHIDRFTK